MAISKRKSRLFKLLILVITLGACYVALRIYVGPAQEAGPEIMRWQQLNDSLNLANKAYAEGHPFKFTDRPRSVEKDSGIFRIAVLGDSFIWGDGLPYDSAWSHKLEQRILAQYDNIEVMHWGRNGWQTKQQVEFYTTEGYKFKPDLLILGFVDNDPDMGRFEHMHYDFRNNYWLFYKIWPSLAEKVLSKAYSHSYNKWLKRLYGDENLQYYSGIWKSFMQELAKADIDYFIVQTPACLSPECHTYYREIQPFFSNLDLEYVDLYPTAFEKLGHLPYDSLRANLANYHPGTRMTNLFADEVLSYLQQTGRLK